MLHLFAFQSYCYCRRAAQLEYDYDSEASWDEGCAGGGEEIMSEDESVCVDTANTVLTNNTLCFVLQQHVCTCSTSANCFIANLC
jgi:Chromatin assembly factor 1 subunit A